VIPARSLGRVIAPSSRSKRNSLESLKGVIDHLSLLTCTTTIILFIFLYGIWYGWMDGYKKKDSGGFFFFYTTCKVWYGTVDREPVRGKLG